MKNKSGKVYIVGAGPGDPELITVKGLKAIKDADCILYDFLSNIKLLNFAKKNTEKICVGKKDGLHLKEQEETNKLLYKKAKKYKKVVRLKGGDPFVFSRGFEEMKYLKSKGIRVEVVPGVTSAFAGPGSFGIPLTIKGKISSIGVVTGRKKDPKAPMDAPLCDTLIYLMGVSNVGNIIKALIRSGRTYDTPCAFIEKGTYPEERIVYGDLGSIKRKIREENIKPPAIFIVGDVLNHV